LKKESNKIIKLTALSIPIKKNNNNKTKIKQIKNKYPCFLYLNFNNKKNRLHSNHGYFLHGQGLAEKRLDTLFERSSSWNGPGLFKKGTKGPNQKGQTSLGSDEYIIIKHSVQILYFV
jgi:hypothetical protein